MGLGTVRAGAPVKGTTAADGTDGSLTLPRIILFDPPVRPCIVTNHCTGGEILVKVNTELSGTVSETFSAANGLGHVIIPPNITLADAAKDHPEGGARWADVSFGGLVAVHSVAISTVGQSGHDLDDVSVIGFEP